jgi:hypothetical protein
MPNEILLNIMGRLNITDNASLALTCKHLARIATTYQILHFKLRTGPGTLQITRFFKALANSWNLVDMKYCQRCKKFRPGGEKVWREYPRKWQSRGKEDLEPGFSRRPCPLDSVDEYWWHTRDDGPRCCPDCCAYLNLLWKLF